MGHRKGWQNHRHGKVTIVSVGPKFSQSWPLLHAGGLFTSAVLTLPWKSPLFASKTAIAIRSQDAVMAEYQVPARWKKYGF